MKCNYVAFLCFLKMKKMFLGHYTSAWLEQVTDGIKNSIFCMVGLCYSKEKV